MILKNVSFPINSIIVHCATRAGGGGNLTFLARMMIERGGFTSAENHDPSLKKSVAPLLHIVLLLISAGIWPSFAWKVDGYIEPT